MPLISPFSKPYERARRDRRPASESSSTSALREHQLGGFFFLGGGGGGRGVCEDLSFEHQADVSLSASWRVLSSCPGYWMCLCLRGCRVGEVLCTTSIVWTSVGTEVSDSKQGNSSCLCHIGTARKHMFGEMSHMAQRPAKAIDPASSRRSPRSCARPKASLAIFAWIVAPPGQALSIGSFALRLCCCCFMLGEAGICNISEVCPHGATPYNALQLATLPTFLHPDKTEIQGPPSLKHQDLKEPEKSNPKSPSTSLNRRPAPSHHVSTLHSCHRRNHQEESAGRPLRVQHQPLAYSRSLFFVDPQSMRGHLVELKGALLFLPLPSSLGFCRPHGIKLQGYGAL